MKKLLLIVMSMLFLLLSCSKTAEQRLYPVLGQEPVKNAGIFENSSEVLVSWLTRDYKKMAVVHVGAQGGLAFLPEENIKDAKALVSDKNWKELERSIASVNYLYFAIRLGIVKKIFWVVPNRFFEYSDAERRIKVFLAGSPSRFRTDDISKMKLERGCVTGKLYGVHMSICSPETLPFIQEPVILDTGIDFFSVYASEKGISKLRGLKEFFDLMNRKNLRVMSADVSLLPDDPLHRYIGKQVFEVLNNPEILKSGEPPKLWAVSDNAENMLSSGADKEVLEYLKKPLTEYTGEHSLLMFKAMALVRTGKEKDSLAILEWLCKAEKSLCSGLLFTGKELKKAGKTEVSKLFFSRAVELYPDLAGRVPGD